jgi:hypothetical protein
MSVIARTPWLRRFAAIVVAVVGIGALTIPTTSTQARVFVGFGIGGPIGWGYYAPSPYYGYYGYPYYPAYSYYGYPRFFIGGAFGPHRHWHHYRHW